MLWFHMEFIGNEHSVIWNANIYHPFPNLGSSKFVTLHSQCIAAKHWLVAQN